MHQWSSGKIVPCHGTDPGSIPGWCKLFSIQQEHTFSFVLYSFCTATKRTFIQQTNNRKNATNALLSWTGEADRWRRFSCNLSGQQTSIPLRIESRNGAYRECGYQRWWRNRDKAASCSDSSACLQGSSSTPSPSFALPLSERPAGPWLLSLPAPPVEFALMSSTPSFGSDPSRDRRHRSHLSSDGWPESTDCHAACGCSKEIAKLAATIRCLQCQRSGDKGPNGPGWLCCSTTDPHEGKAGIRSFDQRRCRYLNTYASRNRRSRAYKDRSRAVTRRMETPSFPARAVRPERWTKSWGEKGRW